MTLVVGVSISKHQRFLGTVRDTYDAIALARTEALREGTRTLVRFDPGRLTAFVDRNGNWAFDVGVDRKIKDVPWY